MNLFYRIWVDCIIKARSVPSNKNDWKLFTMFFMTMAMALNLGTVLSIIQLHILGYVFYDINFSIFPGEKLNNLLSFFTLYITVPLLINYFLIFRKNRFKKLLQCYKYSNGRLFLSYFIGSVLGSLIYGLLFTSKLK